MKNIRCFLILIFCGFGSFAQATDHIQDCNGCNVANATAVAQILGYGYADGNHTVFVINLDIPTAWQVDIYVETIVLDPLFGIGYKESTILSVTNAPQDMNDGLQIFKDLGGLSLQFGPTIDFVVDASGVGAVISECPSAGYPECASLNTFLSAQNETIAYNAFLSLLWAKLAAVFTASEVFPLRYLVIYPDLTMEILEIQALSAGIAFRLVENTAATASGAPIAGGSGSLAGWGSFFYGGMSQRGIGHVTTSSNCVTTVTQVLDDQLKVVSVSRITTCD